MVLRNVAQNAILKNVLYACYWPCCLGCYFIPPSPPHYFQTPYLQTLYTQVPLHTIFFTPRQFSTQAFWRTEALTHILSRAGVFTHILEKDTLQHIRFYTQVLLSTSAFALRRFCTHTDAFTHRRFYTQKLLHSYIFAHRSFWHKFGTRQSEFYLSARRLTRVSSGNVSSSTSVRQKKIAMLLQFFDDRQAFR